MFANKSELNNNKIVVEENHILESSDGILKFRIGFYSVNLVFIFLTVCDLVNIDYGAHGDDRLLDAQHNRFRYYTIWNYQLHLIYMPLAIFCDYLELKRRHKSPNVRKWCAFRHFFATCPMTLTTFYVDMIFWGFWLYDRELIVPSYCDLIISNFNQHCLHSLTLTTAFVDLFTVPRRKPKQTLWHHLTYATMVAIYMIVVAGTFFETGKWIYPFMNDFGFFKSIGFTLFTIFSKTFFFYLQWPIVDFYWSIMLSKNKIKSQ